MLIPLLITATVNLFFYEFGDLNVHFKQVAIVLLSVSIGAQMTLKTMRTLKKVFGPAVCIILILILMGLGLGFMLFLITPIDLVTALLSSIPGGAASITAIASDIGADQRIVASLHLIRLMLLSLLVPTLFYFIPKNHMRNLGD